MKKTLLVTNDFSPKTGGVAQYYTKICELLDSDRIIVLHVVAGFTPALFRAEKNAVPAIIRKPWCKHIPRWLQSVWFIWLAVREHNIEIVWVGDILPFGTACYILKKFNLVKEYIVSVHGLDINLAFQNKPKLTRKILEYAKAITANSYFTKSIMTEKGIEDDKITVVYPCVYVVEGFTPARVGANRHPPILLTVARLVKRKGIDDVIKSLPKVWHNFPDLEYHIVGDGPEREYLQNVGDGLVPARVGASSNGGLIKFLGSLHTAELEKIYEQADLFIMTPKQLGPDVEGFGIVYLEAGAHGLPVIATRTGGVPEAVEDGVNGLLVEPGDTDAIAKAIIKLLTNKDLATKLAEQGMGRIKKFAWEKTSELMFTIFCDRKIL